MLWTLIENSLLIKKWEIISEIWRKFRGACYNDFSTSLLFSHPWRVKCWIEESIKSLYWRDLISWKVKPAARHKCSFHFVTLQYWRPKINRCAALHNGMFRHIFIITNTFSIPPFIYCQIRERNIGWRSFSCEASP